MGSATCVFHYESRSVVSHRVASQLNMLKSETFKSDLYFLRDQSCSLYFITNFTMEKQKKRISQISTKSNMFSHFPTWISRSEAFQVNAMMVAWCRKSSMVSSVHLKAREGTLKPNARPSRLKGPTRKTVSHYFQQCRYTPLSFIYLQLASVIMWFYPLTHFLRHPQYMDHIVQRKSTSSC